MTRNFIAPTVMIWLTGLVTIVLPVVLEGIKLKGTTFYVMRSTISETVQVSIQSWSTKPSCHLGHSQVLLRRMGLVGTLVRAADQLMYIYLDGAGVYPLPWTSQSLVA